MFYRNGLGYITGSGPRVCSPVVEHDQGDERAIFRASVAVAV